LKKFDFGAMETALLNLEIKCDWSSEAFVLLLPLKKKRSGEKKMTKEMTKQDASRLSGWLLVVLVVFFLWLFFTLANANDANAKTNTNTHTSMNMTQSSDPDQEFLRMMIPHHQSAIDMSQSYLANPKAENPEIRHLATSIIRAQKKEIDLMRRLLNESC
jgi:uncharacterized protein (DUF305 family)